MVVVVVSVMGMIVMGVGLLVSLKVVILMVILVVVVVVVFWIGWII